LRQPACNSHAALEKQLNTTAREFRENPENLNLFVRSDIKKDSGGGLPLKLSNLFLSQNHFDLPTFMKHKDLYHLSHHFVEFS
jgi:hypothetical protein